MRASRRPTAVAVGLVPLGTIASHAAGYLLAGRDASFAGSHGHLRPGGWLAALAAAAALAWVATGRDGATTRPRAYGLAVAQAAVFLGLEVAEHAVARREPVSVLHEPAVRWGLAAQLVVGAALVAVTGLARGVGERVRAVLSARRRRPDVPAPAPPATSVRVRSVAAPAPATERGPPTLLVPA